MHEYNSHFFNTYDQIKKWLERVGINQYYIEPETLMVNTDESIVLSYKHIEKFPVKFNQVNGTFNINNTPLNSLIGAPNVVTGDFICGYNSLRNLIGAPQYVGGDFYCHNNFLSSLNGAPAYVGKDFCCHTNKLSTLVGMPTKIGRDVICHENPLISLEGCPPIINGILKMDITATSLHNINSFVKSLNFLSLLLYSNSSLKGLLKIFLIKNLQELGIAGFQEDESKAVVIINKHLNSDRSGPACQIELIDAGLSDYVKI